MRYGRPPPQPCAPGGFLARSAVEAMPEGSRQGAMMRRKNAWTVGAASALAALTATGAAPARAEEPAAEQLEREIEELRRQNE